MWNRNAASLGLPSTWLRSLCDDDLPSLLRHHSVTIRSGRFDLLDTATGTSVLSTNNHRRTQLRPSCPSLFPFCLFVSWCFLSWGEECECVRVCVLWSWWSRFPEVGAFQAIQWFPKSLFCTLLLVFSPLLSSPLSTPPLICFSFVRSLSIAQDRCWHVSLEAVIWPPALRFYLAVDGCSWRKCHCNLLLWTPSPTIWSDDADVLPTDFPHQQLLCLLRHVIMLVWAVHALFIERKCEGVCVCDGSVQREDNVFLEVSLTPALVVRPQ